MFLANAICFGIKMVLLVYVAGVITFTSSTCIAGWTGADGSSYLRCLLP